MQGLSSKSSSGMKKRCGTAKQDHTCTDLGVCLGHDRTSYTKQLATSCFWLKLEVITKPNRQCYNCFPELPPFYCGCAAEACKTLLSFLVRPSYSRLCDTAHLVPSHSRVNFDELRILAVSDLGTGMQPLNAMLRAAAPLLHANDLLSPLFVELLYAL